MTPSYRTFFISSFRNTIRKGSVTHVYILTNLDEQIFLNVLKVILKKVPLVAFGYFLECIIGFLELRLKKKENGYFDVYCVTLRKHSDSAVVMAFACSAQQMHDRA